MWHLQTGQVTDVQKHDGSLCALSVLRAATHASAAPINKPACLDRVLKK